MKLTKSATEEVDATLTRLARGQEERRGEKRTQGQGREGSKCVFVCSHRGWAAPMSHGLPTAAASRASSSRAPTQHCEGGPSDPSTRSPVHGRRVSSWAFSKGRGTCRAEIGRRSGGDAAEMRRKDREDVWGDWD